ncbi:hypothetical protein EV426DRAFT_575716 [Tirmania nivea]|nr:hypothetical protein EV426DRAFT_575716 [Tirmania nivea]
MLKRVVVRLWSTQPTTIMVQLILDKTPNAQVRELEIVFDLTGGKAYVGMKKGGHRNDFLVTQLLDKSAMAEKAGVFKMTALHKEVREGHVEMVQLLLERGGNIRATTTKGPATLHMAANHPPSQSSAFSSNQGARSSRIVELLLNQGAEIFKEDNNGKALLGHLPNSNPQFNSLVNTLLLAEMERFVTVPRTRGSSPPPPAYGENSNTFRVFSACFAVWL